VLEDEDDEPDCEVKIASSRKTDQGNWVYQVRSKATNNLVRDGEWFHETSLRRG